MCLIDGEREFREDSLAAIEAEMNGGNQVVIALVTTRTRSQRTCDPRPGDEPPVFCWHGPDRTTVDDAVDDDVPMFRCGTTGRDGGPMTDHLAKIITFPEMSLNADEYSSALSSPTGQRPATFDEYPVSNRGCGHTVRNYV